MSVHSPDLRAFVAGWEGCKLEPYEDVVGVWTCGYGHVLKPGESREPWTQHQADQVLDDDLATHGGRLRPFLLAEPTQQQFDALLSLAFNVGVGAVGKSGLMSLHNTGDHARCADRFRVWCMAGGKEVPGLRKRREAERAIYLSGDYTGRP